MDTDNLETEVEKPRYKKAESIVSVIDGDDGTDVDDDVKLYGAE